MEALIIVVVFAILIYAISKKFSFNKPKAGEKFICSGCGLEISHNKRTISAWGRGSRKFFCQNCHGSWRFQQLSPAAKKQSSGCLVSLLLILGIPTFLLLALVWYV